MLDIRIRRRSLFLILALIPNGLSLSCYQCVSTQPGCSSPLDWRWHWSVTCEGTGDKCVKVIERKGADEVITRSCLSNLEYLRHDIPADTYEGCRIASKDIKLAHYVNNTIKQLDIKRDFYDDVMWCFCEFDHFCNNGFRLIESTTFILSCFAIPLVLNWVYGPIVG